MKKYYLFLMLLVVTILATPVYSQSTDAFFYSPSHGTTITKAEVGAPVTINYHLGYSPSNYIILEAKVKFTYTNGNNSGWVSRTTGSFTDHGTGTCYIQGYVRMRNPDTYVIYEEWCSSTIYIENPPPLTAVMSGPTSLEYLQSGTFTMSTSGVSHHIHTVGHIIHTAAVALKLLQVKQAMAVLLS